MSNQNNTLVSVVVPVYNVKEYLVNCLDSIVSQTYKNIQIILVDDGSSDGSTCICKQYAKEDDRVELIYKENGGLSDARNFGIQRAKGEYITFIDSDDCVSRYYVENLLNLSQKTGCDIAITNFEKINDDKNLRLSRMGGG